MLSDEGPGDGEMSGKKPKELKAKICRFANTRWCSHYQKDAFTCNHDEEAVVYCGIAKQM